MKVITLKIKCLAAVLLLSTFFVSAQSVSRIEPPNWWVGMKNEKLQLMVYGENISALSPSIASDFVKIEKVHKVDNPNYLFVDLIISEDAPPGKIKIEFKEGTKSRIKWQYELLERREGSANRMGFTPKDVMYLITPDRFANGNPKNDEIEGYEDKLNRDSLGGRHGGDVAGILQNLDYIGQMGFTSIWLNPILENAQPAYSYHGYATTDYYKVDPRYGSNEEYQQLSAEAKKRGIGIIMDMIVNHCGHRHWWMSDLPSKDWINYMEVFEKTDTAVKTNHMKATIQDPYVAHKDLDGFIHGWFTNTMPDLNVRNEYLALYLIQNSIWWVEYADLQGIRMDTYPYPDKAYMSDWTCALMEEYPNFNIVGEEWHTDPAIVSFWQRGKENPNGYTSCLPSLMDFPIQADLIKSLNADESGWASGWKDVYETLAKDFLYPDPFNLVIFPDNHDMSRIYTQLKEDVDLLHLAIAYYTVMRGIPQFYYGTEILMANPNSDDHGEIRSDFPGGWEGDEINGFTGKGLSEKQMNTQEFVKTLLNWRKNSEAIHKGNLLHYAPEKNSVYVIFRYTEDDKVMTVLSKNENAVRLDLSRFVEMLKGDEKGIDIVSGSKIDLSKGLIVPAKSPMIIDFE